MTRHEIGKAAGHEIANLVARKNWKLAIYVMALEASKGVRNLYEKGNLDGIISLGRGQGTYISTTALRNLPFGVPKVMVSLGGAYVETIYSG